MENRGGTRTGAGRKPHQEKKKGFNLYIEPSKLILYAGSAQKAKEQLYRDINYVANKAIAAELDRNVYSAEQCTDINDVNIAIKATNKLYKQYPWSEILRIHIADLEKKKKEL